jgi:rod shape-determining protein MreC
VVAIPSYWDERKLLVFVTLTIIALALTLLEIDAARHGRQTPIDEFIGGVLTPIESALSAATNGIANETRIVLHANGLAAENQRLSQKMHDLAGANERLKGYAVENRELKRMLGMQRVLTDAGVAANIVGYVPEGLRKEITIDRGWRDGVKVDDVVVGGAGLVGHVLDVGRHQAHVLLITDPSSAVPAYLLRTASWGIVTGTFLHAKMKYINQDVRVHGGDLVVTGRGEVYPPGIPIGRVIQVDRKDNALYQSAVLQPSEDFGSITRVLVMEKR